MGNISLYQLLLIFAAGGFVYLIYLRGNRKNKHINSFIAKELEAAINPINKSYKNLGGTIGYKAFYTRNGYINKVVAVFTTLPRHSIAVYPFHLLFGGHDKLQLNIYSEKEIIPNFICIKKKRRYLKLLNKYNTEGLTAKDQEYGTSTFLLYYKDSQSLDICDALIKESLSDNLISMAANPENNSFHLYFIPKEGKIEHLVKTFLSMAKNYLEK